MKTLFCTQSTSNKKSPSIDNSSTSEKLSEDLRLDPESSLQYRQIQRKPILEKITIMATGFSSFIDTRDAAAFYSGIKSELSKLWEFLIIDEPLTEGVATLESVLKYNRWDEFNEVQARVLTKTIGILSSENITSEVIDILALNLNKNNINLFPYEEKQERS